MNRKTIKIGVILILLGGIGYVLTITGLYSPTIQNFLNRKDFIKEQWISWEESEADLSLRWDMVNDLLSEHELVGMNEAEIIELLGKPDFQAKHNNKPTYSFHYNLGATRSGVNYGSLFINFEGNTVISFNVHDH